MPEGRHPLVFVPGMMDSDVALPGAEALADWGPFLDHLVDELGYERDVDLFPFPYDWRRPVTASAEALRDRLAEWTDRVRATRGLADDAPVRFVLVGASLISLAVFGRPPSRCSTPG